VVLNFSLKFTVSRTRAELPEETAFLLFRQPQVLTADRFAFELSSVNLVELKLKRPFDNFDTQAASAKFAAKSLRFRDLRSNCFTSACFPHLAIDGAILEILERELLSRGSIGHGRHYDSAR
jgi:hypothetical protein